jgi:hypothetical protein
MTLYKYAISDRKDVLINGLIRFTQPSALNDPWEMKPYIESLMSDETWEKEIRAKAIEEFNSGDYGSFRGDNLLKTLSEVIWKQMNRHQRRSQTPRQIEQALINAQKSGVDIQSMYKGLYLKNYNARVDEAYLRQRELVSTIPALLDKKLGILSLSEDPTHRLMWSHYAGTYSGFVIAFDEGHSFFNSRRTSEDELNYLRRVVYSGERPSMKAFVDFNEEHLSSAATKLFLTKGQEWYYEREWRMLKALKDANKIIELPGGNIHLYSLPPESITGVVLGHRMKPKDRDEIIALIKGDARYDHVTLSETALSETSYDVEIKPVTLR